MSLRFPKLILAFGIVAQFGAALACADGATDLRPVWAWGETGVPLNASILYSNQNPAFLNQGFGVLSKQQVNQLRQDYEDRNRDYDMRSAYGINGQNDEMDHEQSMKDMGHEVINSARNTTTQQYGQNIDNAQKSGDIAQPLVYAGGAVGVVNGTPIKMHLGQNTQATWSTNAINRQSQLDVKSSDMVASARMDQSSGAIEHYSLSVNKPLFLGVGSGVTYGGTSNTVSATLSHPIVGPLSASVGGSMPTNQNNNPTGAVTQGTVGVNYGMKF
jgi:hypothetical protein